MTNHPRILLIDDNPAIHEDFRKILAAPAKSSASIEAAESILFGEIADTRPGANFEIDSAFQGKEALAMVLQARDHGRPYAMAFVDVRMPPGWDGIQTVKHLWKECPDLQIVICTAYSDYMWDDIIRELGHSDNLVILKKPFDNIEVMQLAHAMTRKWQVTQQANLRMDELDRMVAGRTLELQAANENLKLEIIGRTRAQEALVATESHLRQAQKMEAIGQLAAGVAHDFNNVLTVIQGHASMQLSAAKASPDMTGSLQQILDASERAASITHQLLAFSRRQVMKLRVLDLNELLDEISGMLHRLIGENIALHFEFEEALPFIRADLCNIEQIVINLAVNARDAMPRGGSISIRTARAEIDTGMVARNPEAIAGTHVRISVRDTGCGMDAATVEHIFEPFFTTKAPGAGTGMGMATVHGIVKQHNGWIEIESEPGRGTAFHIFLPVADGIPDAGTEPPLSAIFNGDGKTVLVVEDEEAVRAMLRESLQRLGYRVIEAASATEALSAWRSCPKSIVLLLTDVIMPGGMSGRELADTLLAERPDLRVIYTSGYDTDRTEPGLLREGINYLPKPYTTATLADAVYSALEKEAMNTGGV